MPFLQLIYWCCNVQFFLQLVSQHWKKKSTASCKRHVTRCNFGVELCNGLKIIHPIVASRKQLRDKLQRGMLHAATYLQLVSQLHYFTSRVTLAVELRSTFCNDCKDFFKPLQLAARDYNVFFESITSCSPRLHRVKATSHSTIFDIPIRPLREDQKHRHRFTR